jgi:hypothetical protein
MTGGFSVGFDRFEIATCIYFDATCVFAPIE